MDPSCRDRQENRAAAAWFSVAAARWETFRVAHRLDWAARSEAITLLARSMGRHVETLSLG